MLPMLPMFYERRMMQQRLERSRLKHDRASILHAGWFMGGYPYNSIHNPTWTHGMQIVSWVHHTVSVCLVFKDELTCLGFPFIYDL